MTIVAAVVAVIGLSLVAFLAWAVSSDARTDRASELISRLFGRWL